MKFKYIIPFLLAGLFISGCSKKTDINDLQGGVITFVLGNVKVKTADGKISDAKSEMFLMFAQTITTGPASYADIQFMDGVVIRVKEKTQLVVKDIWVNSKEFQIQAKLDVKGRIFAKSGKLSKDSEFTVTTPTIVAGVRGTEFIVDSEKSSTLVNDGSVAVTTPGEGEETVVDAGKKATLGKDQDFKVNDLTDAEKAEMEKDSQSVASITEDARMRIQEILKDFEENKARIKQHLEEQKEQNRQLIEGQKEGDKALLEEQKAKDKAMMDEVKGSVDAEKSAIKEGSAAEKSKIMNTKEELQKQKKGNLKDQLAPN